MDLQRVTDDLKDLEGRLEILAGPVRSRLQGLGPAGLYALAADEQRAADLAKNADARSLHALAAVAAQALADAELLRR